MRNLVLLIILIAFGLQSCNFGSSRTWKDGDIEESVRKEIQKLDAKIINAVATGNPYLLKSIMSDKLLEESSENVDQAIEILGSRNIAPSYQLLNQFYVRNLTKGLKNTVFSEDDGVNSFSISYMALSKEMFISLLIPNGDMDEIIITSIYGKYPEGWKLNIVHFGQYRLNGQTAPELYTRAKIDYENGYLIDAANNMFLCAKVVNPASKNWQYEDADRINQFHDLAMTEVNERYEFPLILESLDTKPEVFSIYPQKTEKGYFPMIEYVTRLDILDTAKTRAENDLVHMEIIGIFEGIDKDKDFIFYKAFSQLPDGMTEVSTYGYVKELNEKRWLTNGF